MPCDSVTTQRISEALANAMPPVLLTALKADGWTVDEDTAGMIRASRYGSERLVWTAGKGVTKIESISLSILYLPQEEVLRGGVRSS